MQELYYADKMIDRRGDRTAAIERANRIRSRFNEITFDEENPIEPVFLVESAKHKNTPAAEVKVLAVEGEAGIVGWIQQAEANAGNGGFGGPFHINHIWRTKEMAIRAGVGEVIRWTLGEVRRSDTPKSGKAECEVVIRECRKILNPPAIQPSLF